MPIPPQAIGMIADKAKAIPATILGVAEAATGFFRGRKAKKEAEKLRASRPQLDASPYIDDQLSLAESELSTGLGGATETAYEEGLDRDLSSSLNAILQGGGDVNNVAQIFDRSATGRQRLSMMKENLRLSQINNLVNAQAAAENERLQRFQFNEWAPWSDDASANAAARQGAENMLWGGLQTVAGAVTGGMQSNATQGAFNNYMGGGQQGGSAGNSAPVLRSTMSTSVPMNYGRAGSPANAYGSINPNYVQNMFGNNGIDENLFYPSEMY